ncbi:secreted RxLR effector protein 161-like [Raphanus sativus]|uniref:Secreted RxLR effector protein 161-like n=1 Tax=Raphanus sativus TaxID=3726 RepID=A0A9W3CBJ9_RAPSA|nr:secreted RxLR effector protein 161-like [Raphanus sativus]
MEDVPYSSAVGSLMYAMVGSRPDLAYAVGMGCRYMSQPGREHWSAVKWIMRYIRGALKVNLSFKKGEDFKIRGYCDSDYATDRDCSRSITGYIYTVGGNTVSWRSSLQKVVALSTTEAEYMALSDAVREGIWLKGICEELKLNSGAVEVHCDSQSAIYLARNFVYREKTKHIATKYNFIRDIIADGIVELRKIHTSVNPADMLTKVLPEEKFEGCLAKLGVMEA